MCIPPLSIYCVYIAITSIGSLHTAVLEGWLFFMLTCTVSCLCILAAYHTISPHYNTTHSGSIDKCTVKNYRAVVKAYVHASYPQTMQYITMKGALCTWVLSSFRILSPVVYSTICDWAYFHANRCEYMCQKLC